MKAKPTPSVTAAAPSGGAATLCIYGGMLLIIIAVLLPILGKGVLTARWIYAAGAAVNLVGRFMVQGRVSGMPLRLKRLYRLEMWSGIFFAVAAFFMFYTPATSDWLAFTLAGGAVLVYTSLMIAREMRKKS